MHPRRAGSRLVAGVAALLLLLGGSVASGQDAGKSKILLRGAGATFPAPLYEKWIQTYRQQHPGS